MECIHSVLVLGLAAGFLGCGAEPTETGDTKHDGADRVFVADEESGTISVIDEATRERTATIALPMGGDMYMPHNVQVAPDGQSVWVAAPPMTEGSAPDKVFVVDPETNAISAEIELGIDMHVAHVVLSPDSSRAYVTANEASVVLELDGFERTLLRSIDLGLDKGPHGARFCGDVLYVANMTGRSLSLIHPAMNMVEEVPLGGVAVQTACTPDGRFVFVSLFDTKEVIRYEIDGGAITRVELPAGAQGPVQLYPSPDSKLMWVCDQGLLEGRPASNRLFRVDVGGALVTGEVTVGNGAHGVVVSDEGDLAYVTNIADGTVSVVDTERLESIATIPVGDKPNGVSHWHHTGGMP